MSADGAGQTGVERQLHLQPPAWLLLSSGTDEATAGENLMGQYLINHNFLLHYMGVESQTGNSFSGRFSDGSRFTGAYFPASVGGGVIVFNRNRTDGSAEFYHGTASFRSTAAGKDVIFSGQFFHNGSGPLPWFATGSLRG